MADTNLNILLTTGSLVQLQAEVTRLTAENERLMVFVSDISKQKPERPDYWSSCGQCERNTSTAEDIIEAAQAEKHGN